jgi:hypothetical protein
VKGNELIRELIKRLPYRMAEELKQKSREPLNSEVVLRLFNQVKDEEKRKADGSIKNSSQRKGSDG